MVVVVKDVSSKEGHSLSLELFSTSSISSLHLLRRMGDTVTLAASALVDLGYIAAFSFTVGALQALQPSPSTASFVFSAVQKMNDAPTTAQPHETFACIDQLLQERPFMCLVMGCGQTFKREEHLRRHDITHTRPKVQCPTCGESFAHMSSLVRHQGTHSQRRPHVCRTCEITFARSDHLRKHEKVHSNTKAFVCATCNKAFIAKPDLTRHEYGHAASRRHKCTLCTRSFEVPSRLLKHMNKHHIKPPASHSTLPPLTPISNVIDLYGMTL